MVRALFALDSSVRPDEPHGLGNRGEFVDLGSAVVDCGGGGQDDPVPVHVEDPEPFDQPGAVGSVMGVARLGLPEEEVATPLFSRSRRRQDHIGEPSGQLVRRHPLLAVPDRDLSVFPIRDWCQRPHWRDRERDAIGRPAIGWDRIS